MLSIHFILQFIPVMILQSVTDLLNESGKNLSLPYTFISGTLSDGELQSLWSKAFQLSKMKVLKVPVSDGNTWWVFSDSSPSPHIVTKSKTNTGRYMCDNHCVGWKSRNICCLAVAEVYKQLKHFLIWFHTTKSSNLTKAWILQACWVKKGGNMGMQSTYH